MEWVLMWCWLTMLTFGQHNIWSIHFRLDGAGRALSIRASPAGMENPTAVPSPAPASRDGCSDEKRVGKRRARRSYLRRSQWPGGSEGEAHGGGGKHLGQGGLELRQGQGKGAAGVDSGQERVGQTHRSLAVPMKEMGWRMVACAQRSASSVRNQPWRRWC